MFDNDEAFGVSKNKESLQDMQLDQSATSICNKYHKDQIAVGIIRECLKIAENDDAIYNKLIADIKTMQMDMISMALKK